MTLDPEVAQLLETVRLAGAPPFDSLTPTQARDAYAKARIASTPIPKAVERAENIKIEGPNGSIPMRFYWPKNGGAKPLPLLVYFHGGGWLLGDLESHDGVCRHLANGGKCAVLAVDYRLAPENKFPAAVDDAFAATIWAVENASQLNITPDKIAVGGDSAGGNLAVVVCMMARDAGKPKIHFQLLLYPALDFSFDTKSHQDFANGFSLTRSSLLWFRSHYLTSPADGSDFRASPLKAKSLAGLPPACILTAEYDPLRDEGEAYAARLAQEANVPVTFWRAAGQIHGFVPMGKLISASAPTLDALARNLKCAFI